MEWHDLKKCSSIGFLVVELSSRTPAGLLPRALGSTDYEHGRIVVFYDRIAGRLPGKDSVLLAHVLAHEITHALIGVSHHSETGLMKADWELEDLFAMLFSPLPFAPGEVDLLHRGLDARESRLALLQSVH